ncbi:hypothetical protein MTR67_039153 [Solanum verrucosum]|uniref:Integrase core domain containing protein n=1 Tax=Solanum verrucosum TaxID=315347 RepID=A0AAF0ZQ50_SOLVR|nr:hypothetical protein MTR67_039153 [Solanum verrucosum]
MAEILGRYIPNTVREFYGSYAMTVQNALPPRAKALAQPPLLTTLPDEGTIPAPTKGPNVTAPPSNSPGMDADVLEPAPKGYVGYVVLNALFGEDEPNINHVAGKGNTLRTTDTKEERRRRRSTSVRRRRDNCCGLKLVNAVGTNSGQCPDDANFEALYNEEMQYLGNQMGGSHTNYQQQGGNQGWNKDKDNGWKDWRGGNWRDREADQDRYVPPMIFNDQKT